MDANAERVRRWMARYKAEHGHPYRDNFERKAKPRKPCGWCGTLHSLNDSGTTLDADGLAHAQWLSHYGYPSESREIAVWRPTPRMTASIECAECAERFTFEIPCGERRYCSARCSSRAAWRRRSSAGFDISSGRRHRLYERDGWTCQICLEAVSREHVATDPWAPTLDHIEPQAATLLPDHSDANLRTAHALCNSLRGDDRMTDDDVRRLVAERWLTSI